VEENDYCVPLASPDLYSWPSNIYLPAIPIADA